MIKKKELPMNPLKEYLFYKRMTITDFAKMIGVSRHHISQITLNKYHPSKLLAEEIERKTEGEVKSEDLLKGKL
jgi:DNA-binding XRE family transcriptional regulator